MRASMLTKLKNSIKYRNSMFNAYKWRSTFPMPDLHILSEKCEVKLDFLYPLRKQPPPSPVVAAHECSLAGQPKVLPAATLQLREDIMEKWNQKPQRDIHKELVKRKYTY